MSGVTLIEQACPSCKYSVVWEAGTEDWQSCPNCDLPVKFFSSFRQDGAAERAADKQRVVDLEIKLGFALAALAQSGVVVEGKSTSQPPKNHAGVSETPAVCQCVATPGGMVAISSCPFHGIAGVPSESSFNNDGGYVFDNSGKIVGVDPDYKPRLLDTPSFAASTLREIATWLQWERMEDEKREVPGVEFLRQLADELEA